MTKKSPFLVRAARSVDRPWIECRLQAAWGATTVVRRDEALDAAGLPALLALDGDGRRVGLATYRLDTAAGDCECVTLDAVHPGRGIGSELLAELASVAKAHRCSRLWLVTTNDNLDAIRFYQRRGMRIVGVDRGAVDRARRLKPSIPEVGEHGIPIHDELELELELAEREDRLG